MKKISHPNKHRLIVSVLFIISSLVACTESTDTESNDEKVKPVIVATNPPGEVHLAPNSPKKVYVKTKRLGMGQHPLLEPLAGKVVYNESLTSSVSSPVAGRVIKTPIALGTPVKVGTVLLELDSPDVADAESDFAKAEADLARAKKAFVRQQELYTGKAISQKDLEQAEGDYNNAYSELRRTHDRLENLHISDKQNDGRFSLRSPLAGVVVERHVNPGIEVRPDREQPLFVISDIKKLTVLMDVYEINIGKIRLGHKLQVSVPAYPGEVFPATVEYIGQVLDEGTRTVQVRCALDNLDGRLLPGMYATINVESEPSDQAIVIPLTAVFTEDEADYVFIAIDENHFKQRQIDIGLRLKDQAVVVDGLKAAEILVTEGALMLRAEEEVETESSTKP